jgi:hypothetical protein
MNKCAGAFLQHSNTPSPQNFEYDKAKRSISRFRNDGLGHGSPASRHGISIDGLQSQRLKSEATRH